MYNLLTKSDVNIIYLKKYVIGFGDYTPPLQSLFTAPLPHPVVTIVIIDAATTRPSTKFVKYIPNRIVRYTIVGL